MKKYFAPIFSIIVSSINAAAIALYVSGLEAETYPVHYDLYMNPDRYGSKWVLLNCAFMPLLIAALFLIYRLATRKNENIIKNYKYENPFFIIITVVFIAFMWFILLSATSALTPNRSWLPYCSVLFGILFILYSNISGKLKQQRHFGIKTKATLNNSTVWRKTHRLSGILGFIVGLITLACGISGIFFSGYEITAFAACLIGFIVLAFFIPTFYAGVLFKKLGCDPAPESEKITEKEAE